MTAVSACVLNMKLNIHCNLQDHRCASAYGLYIGALPEAMVDVLCENINMKKVCM